MPSDLPTFSALGRVLACPASHVLPQVESGGEYADVGRAVHAYLHAVALTDQTTALEHVPKDQRELCEAIPLERLPVGLSPEVPLAYNVVTGEGRFLSAGDGYRNYESATEDEIAGTTDVLGVDANEVYVGDYKTGRPVTPARHNPQMLIAGLAATRATGAPRVRLELIYVHGGSTWTDVAVVDAFELAEFEERVVGMVSILRQVALVPDIAPTTLGPHCRYCPAFSACPEQRALAESMTDGSLEKRINGWVGLITSENAVDAYRKLQQMKALTKRCSDIIAAYTLENGPIDLGDGRRYGPREKMGNEKLNGPIAASLLAGLVGLEAAMACVVPTITKASIHRAAT